MRIKKKFKMDYLNLCRVEGLAAVQDRILDLVIAVREFISLQKDLYFSCTIITPDHRELPGSGPCFDGAHKRDFENSPVLFKELMAQMEAFAAFRNIVEAPQSSLRP